MNQSESRAHTHPVVEAFQRLKPRLLAAGRRLLGNDDDASDALQDTFLKFWGAERDINDGTVVTAMRNVCIDRLRARRRPEELEQVADIADESPPTAGELYENVDTIIRRTLSERDRGILLMRDRDGYDFDTIALRTGLTEAAVRVALSRARRTVRQAYRNINTSQHPHDDEH